MGAGQKTNSSYPYEVLAEPGTQSANSNRQEDFRNVQSLRRKP